MSLDLCTTCHKPPVAANAGSITAYFFQQNYCQCKRNSSRPTITPKVKAVEANSQSNLICANCGKARPIERKVGSFTSFLFKELRCQCPPSLLAHAKAQPKCTDTRTRAATRVAQRQRFSKTLKERSAATDALASQEILDTDTIIGGTFKIRSLLGVGGMGNVYLAEHTALRHFFALKVLAPGLVNEQNWLRFQAEAKTLAALNHSTFVKVYDLGIHKQLVPFYTMDYLTGSSLEEILVANGPIPLEQALDIFLEVLDGLAYANRNGIIHRDIKPANIMLCTVDGASTVKVLDFGISKLIGRETINSQSLTTDGEIFGSPYYMSPEQCSGKAVDNRSDIYSVGCALFESLTTFVPFDGKTSIEIALKHQEDEPPFLADLMPDSSFPASLDLVIGKCLEKLPNERYQSAKELAIDLTRIKEGKNLLAYSPAFAPRHKSGDDQVDEEQRNKIIGKSVTAAFLAVCTALAGSAYWWTMQNDNRARNEPLLAKAASKPLVKLHATDTITLGKMLANQDFIKIALTNQGSSEKITDPDVNATTKYSTIKTINNVSYRCFNFPKSVSIGFICRADSRGISENATGDVLYPKEWRFIFTPARITSQHPEYLKRFRPGEIKELHLYPPVDNDKIMAAASNIPAVEYLSVKDGVGFTPKCAASLNKFKSLKIFNGSASSITGTTLAKANCWQHIEKIYWNKALKPTAMLQKLQSCPELKVLGMREANLTHRDFQLIGKINSLRLLELAQNQVTADDIKALSALTNLTYFNLEECGLTNAAVPELKRLPSLRELQITGDSSINMPKQLYQTLKKELPHTHVH